MMIRDGEFLVGDRAFEYLQVQKGSLDNLRGRGRAEWHAAYEEHLLSTYRSVAEYLPVYCAGILDVGSGLGGIDVLFARHYDQGDERSPQPKIHLLDGLDDKPEMQLHRKTFNNMSVAREFMLMNGVAQWQFDYYGPDAAQPTMKYDLIVSFGAWCFHLEPATYMRFVRNACKPETCLILEVRKSKDLWRAQLEQHFVERAIAHEGRKFLRIVYTVRP